MVSLDATFLIDLLDGTAEAVQKAEELDSSDEPLEVIEKRKFTNLVRFGPLDFILGR